jgi:hypothetical protein
MIRTGAVMLDTRARGPVIGQAASRLGAAGVGEPLLILSPGRAATRE